MQACTMINHNNGLINNQHHKVCASFAHQQCDLYWAGHCDLPSRFCSLSYGTATEPCSDGDASCLAGWERGGPLLLCLLTSSPLDILPSTPSSLWCASRRGDVFCVDDDRRPTGRSDGQRHVHDGCGPASSSAGCTGAGEEVVQLGSLCDPRIKSAWCADACTASVGVRACSHSVSVCSPALTFITRETLITHHVLFKDHAGGLQDQRRQSLEPSQQKWCSRAGALVQLPATQQEEEHRTDA